MTTALQPCELLLARPAGRVDAARIVADADAAALDGALADLAEVYRGVKPFHDSTLNDAADGPLETVICDASEGGGAAG